MTAQTMQDALLETLSRKATHDPMALSEADRVLGVRRGTVAAAVRRKEIPTMRKPGGKLCKVTCASLAGWVAEYWVEA